MRVVVLASGSGGNSALFEEGETRVLVDTGIPPRDLALRLKRAKVTGAPTAIVLTHAHGDHHKYAGEVALAYDIPVFVSESTRRVSSLRGARRLRVFGARDPFSVGDFVVHPLPLPHDAPQVSLRLQAPSGRSATIATDLGEVPPDLLKHLAKSDTVLIESNHDADMLWRGPYSYSLKRRVASSVGHLSNAQTHGLLKALDRRVETVVLMHLSETNNLPALALESAADALADHSARLLVASQDETLAVHPVREQLSLFPVK